jgi:hypothetical protein
MAAAVLVIFIWCTIMAWNSIVGGFIILGIVLIPIILSIYILIKSIKKMDKKLVATFILTWTACLLVLIPIFVLWELYPISLIITAILYVLWAVYTLFIEKSK